MSELSRGWHNFLTFLAEPLFTIGETPMSLVRLVATALVMVLAWWARALRSARYEVSGRTAALNSRPALLTRWDA